MEAALPLLLTFGLMWLLLIRPQQRRMRQHQAVVASLRVGDEIVTAGGILGTVTGLDDEAITLQVAPGVEMRVLRAAVSQRVGPPGSDELDDEDALDDADLDELEASADGEEPGTIAGRAEPSTRDDEPK